MEINESLKNKIYELYDKCVDSIEPFHRKLDLFIVPDELAQRILEETDIDVAGHWVCIDNYGIIHTLEHHGKPISESKRGQIAVMKEDFVTMLQVFLYPDEIHASGKTNNSQKPTITSLKKNKLSRLVFQTMYKVKADKLA
jgi:phage-Barnase-EndoU-ColicinE5/D-RelE like nuclease3